MNNSMINPSIVDLLEKVDNRYSLVVATSKRARQIIEGQRSTCTCRFNKTSYNSNNEIDGEAISSYDNKRRNKIEWKYKRTVVIGVTGGIAVYKALDVISRLRKENIEVHVIMTESATEFVNPIKFSIFKSKHGYS